MRWLNMINLVIQGLWYANESACVCILYVNDIFILLVVVISTGFRKLTEFVGDKPYALFNGVGANSASNRNAWFRQEQKARGVLEVF